MGNFHMVIRAGLKMFRTVAKDPYHPQIHNSNQWATLCLQVSHLWPKGSMRLYSDNQ